MQSPSTFSNSRHFTDLHGTRVVQPPDIFLGCPERRNVDSVMRPQLCLDRLYFSSSDRFLFRWAVPLSISLLASVFPVSFSSRPCLIHARIPDWVGFLCMDTLSCIHGVGCLSACCMELRPCPIFLLFSSCLL